MVSLPMAFIFDSPTHESRKWTAPIMFPEHLTSKYSGNHTDRKVEKHLLNCHYARDDEADIRQNIQINTMVVALNHVRIVKHRAAPSCH